MVCAIWTASVASRLWRPDFKAGPLALEIVLAVVAFISVNWSTGIFMVGSVGGLGFGQFRMNLMGPFNPAFFQLIVPGVPVNGFEWEGVNYVGLGIYILFAVALFTLKPANLKPLAGSMFLTALARRLPQAVARSRRPLP